MTTRTLLFLASALLSTALFAEEQIATTLKATQLFSEPYSDATVITNVAAKQQVTVIERKGGWYQVEQRGQSGWLRMSAIRFGNGETAKRDGKGLAQTLRFLSTGRSGANGVTVATGIRGLDAADVANAKPDHDAVKQLERYSANPQAARKFARNARLKTQQLGYLNAAQGR